MLGSALTPLIETERFSIGTKNSTDTPPNTLKEHQRLLEEEKNKNFNLALRLSTLEQQAASGVASSNSAGVGQLSSQVIQLRTTLAHEQDRYRALQKEKAAVDQTLQRSLEALELVNEELTRKDQSLEHANREIERLSALVSCSIPSPGVSKESAEKIKALQSENLRLASAGASVRKLLQVDDNLSFDLAVERFEDRVRCKMLHWFDNGPLSLIRSLVDLPQVPCVGSAADAQAVLDRTVRDLVALVTTRLQAQDTQLTEARNSLAQNEAKHSAEQTTKDARMAAMSQKLDKYRFILHRKQHFIEEAMKQLEQLPEVLKLGDHHLSLSLLGNGHHSIVAVDEATAVY